MFSNKIILQYKELFPNDALNSSFAFHNRVGSVESTTDVLSKHCAFVETPLYFKFNEKIVLNEMESKITLNLNLKG